MSSRPLAALALAAAVASTACFHAVVETGRPAGTTVVQKNWVNTFIFGLVAAQPIDVTAQCPGGVARIETQQSFVNSLAGIFTLGLYTPQSATVTCAAGRTGARDVRPADPRLNPTGHAVVAIAPDATPAARDAAVRSAALESARTGQPVFVTF